MGILVGGVLVLIGLIVAVVILYVKQANPENKAGVDTKDGEGPAVDIRDEDMENVHQLALSNKNDISSLRSAKDSLSSLAASNHNLAMANQGMATANKGMATANQGMAVSNQSSIASLNTAKDSISSMAAASQSMATASKNMATANQGSISVHDQFANDTSARVNALETFKTLAEDGIQDNTAAIGHIEQMAVVRFWDTAQTTVTSVGTKILLPNRHVNHGDGSGVTLGPDNSTIQLERGRTYMVTASCQPATSWSNVSTCFMSEGYGVCIPGSEMHVESASSGNGAHGSTVSTAFVFETSQTSDAANRIYWEVNKLGGGNNPFFIKAPDVLVMEIRR